jgi:hypothetical protein
VCVLTCACARCPPRSPAAAKAYTALVAVEEEENYMNMKAYKKAQAEL